MVGAVGIGAFFIGVIVGVLITLVVVSWNLICWPQIKAAAAFRDYDYDELDRIYSHAGDFVPEYDEIDLERVENGCN